LLTIARNAKAYNQKKQRQSLVSHMKCKNVRRPQAAIETKNGNEIPEKELFTTQKKIIVQNVNNYQQRICINVKKNSLITLINCQFVRYLFDDSANHNLVLYAFYYCISDPIQRTSYPLLITLRQIKLSSHPILPEPLLLYNY
jgi:hypothetical protein